MAKAAAPVAQPGRSGIYPLSQGVEALGARKKSHQERPARRDRSPAPERARDPARVLLLRHLVCHDLVCGVLAAANSDHRPVHLIAGPAPPPEAVGWVWPTAAFAFTLWGPARFGGRAFPAPALAGADASAAVAVAARPPRPPSLALWLALSPCAAKASSPGPEPPSSSSPSISCWCCRPTRQPCCHPSRFETAAPPTATEWQRRRRVCPPASAATVLLLAQD